MLGVPLGDDVDVVGERVFDDVYVQLHPVELAVQSIGVLLLPGERIVDFD